MRGSVFLGWPAVFRERRQTLAAISGLGQARWAVSYSTQSPDDVDPFFQRRVALIMGVISGLFFVFVIYTPFETLWREAEFNLRVWVWQAVGAVALSLLALYCRSGQRTVRALYILEGSSMLIAASISAFMSSSIHVGYRPEMTMLTAQALALVGRSAFVPSSPQRTFAVGAMLTVPLAVFTWWLYSDYRPPASDYAPMSSLAVTSYVMVWWALACALAALVSRTIYGLRRQVSRAERLGRYELEDKIGEGGMGQVYRARHAMLRRPTAIKLLAKASEQDTARFEREVQMTASLTHPNTVEVFDYGRTPDHIFYYAMEYLDGLNLQQLVETDGAQPGSRVVHLLWQVSGALVEAHGLGLIHRDIKPANIIVSFRRGQGDVSKVLDFGLVKSMSTDQLEPSVTQQGMTMGTPAYMPPEAITDPESVDERSDIYALGAVAYYLLAGRPVFEGKNAHEVYGHHLHSRPRRPAEFQDGIPDELEDLVLRCLQKDPSARPGDLRAVRATLAGSPLFGRWDEEAAQRWWGALAPTAQPRKDSTGRTIAIDIAARDLER